MGLFTANFKPILYCDMLCGGELKSLTLKGMILTNVNQLITNYLSTNIVYVCFSVSLESSVMGHDEMLQVLKEKMRLEGQLESLSSEANQVIQKY